MRKNILGAVFATVAILSACETVEPQDTFVDDFLSESTTESPDIDAKEEFLITANIGADTKTYLEWNDTIAAYKTRWIEGDYIFIVNYEEGVKEWEKCHLISGENTSTGFFSTTLDASKYIAIYSSNFAWDGVGNLYASLLNLQYHFTYSNHSDKKPFKDHAYPMVAVSDDRNLDFYTLCSVLKFTVTGDWEHLKTIRISSNGGELMSGYGLLDFNGETPTMVMYSGDTYVDYMVNETLTSAPLECYVVLPSQTYAEGFTIKLETDKGWMEVTTGTDITLEQSKLHEIKEPIRYETEAYNWVMINDGEYQMTYEDGRYVISGIYMDGSPYFYNPGTGEYLYLSAEYGTSFYPMNTRVNLQSEYYDAMLPTWGWLNVYLDPKNKTVYFTSYDCDLNSLPSLDHVYQSNFMSLWGVEDGQFVMTSGMVKAKSERGFIVEMGYKGYNNILVYDARNEYNVWVGEQVDVYAEKTTYRDLPELKVGVVGSWMYIWSRSNVYNYESPLDLSDSYDFASYSGGQYDLVTYTGTMVKEGNTYNVYVDGVDGRRGQIFYPTEDLSIYNGSVVLVEGYFLGFTPNGDLSTMITSVQVPVSGDGVTEDFFLGDDIQM